MSGEPEAVVTRRQKGSRRCLASPSPPVARPWTAMAALIAPALAPLTMRRDAMAATVSCRDRVVGLGTTAAFWCLPARSAGSLLLG